MKWQQASRILATAFVTLWAGATISGILWSPTTYSSWGDSWVRRFAPASCDALGRRLIVDAENRNVSALLAFVDPRFRDANAGRELAEASGLAKPVLGGTVELIHFGVNRTGSGENCGLLYLVRHVDRTVAVEEVLAQSGESFKLESFYVTRITPKMLAQNALTLAGRSARYWVFAISAIADCLFVAVVMYMCALAPYVRLRWVWLLVIFLGVIRLTMNWTTGQAAIQPIAINVPPAGAAEPVILGPWFVYMDVPLGAVLFLVYRKRLTTKREEPSQWMPTSSSSEPAQPV